MAGTNNEGSKATIPSRLNGNEKMAGYAIQIENSNPDTNYSRKKDNMDPGECKCRDCMCCFFCGFMILGFVIWGLLLIATLEPYSNTKDLIYKHHMKTAEYGIDFYVKSGFSKKHPVGSPARVELANKVIKSFNETEQRYCRHELWYKWLSGDPEYTTPGCDKLLSKGIAIPTTTPVNV